MAKASAKADSEGKTGELIIVINTTMGPFHVPYGPRTGPESHSPCASYTFWPGLNEPVEPDVWDQIKGNPVFMEWRQLEYIEVVHEAPVGLRKRDAEDLIERSASIEAMEWWRGLETSGEIRKLLGVKIAKMKKPLPKDDEEDDEEL